jgi:uncharacterized membrane protein
VTPDPLRERRPKRITSMRKIAALLLGVAAAVPMMLPQEAKADLRFCNRYPYKVSVAFANYDRSCSYPWAKAGWYNINPYQCKTVYFGDLRYNPYYYFYARATNGANWSGAYKTKAPTSAFNLCWNSYFSPYKNIGMRQVYTGKSVTYTVNLTP